MVIFLQFNLIGIKGSGMAGLAHLLLDDGYNVIGSDVDSYVFTQERLLKRDVKIYSLSDKSFFNNCFVVIGHNFMDPFLISILEKNGVPYMEYHKFLSFYVNCNKLVSICGSHGKTTLVGLLSCCDDNSSFLRGDGYGRKVDGETFFFLESCEYKDHFLEYNPSFIVISNIDYDHIDYFHSEKDYVSSFEKFAKKVSFGLINYDDFKKINDPYYFSYGICDRADFYAKDFIVDKNGIRGSIYFQKHFITSFNFTNLYGIPLVMDVVAVVAFYYLNHYKISDVIDKIKGFRMADKRFNIECYGNQVIIDDYAHHPNQMKVNYENVMTIYPSFYHIGIYKPDRESRLGYFNDEIKSVLSKYDMSFVLDFNDKKNVELIEKLCCENVVYLKDINEIVDYLNCDDKYVFSLMSSKNLNEVKEIIKTHFK